MKANTFTELLGLTIVLAIVTDIVTSKNTASIVSNGGNAWAHIINSALGKG